MSNQEPESKCLDRRSFVQTAAAAVSISIVNAVPGLALAGGTKEVSAVEDLMREHGALNRILLIYDEVLRRLGAKQEIDLVWINRAARIIHDFIEGYHEKLEEEHLFPRLKKAGKLVDLVDTLITQHQAGRKVTSAILELSTDAHLKSASERARLEDSLSRFNRMYRPHEAREDTVVFPAFKMVVTPKEYDRLGDVFEKREHQLFGKDGFEGILAKITEIEKALGIYDLAKFTP